MAKNDTTSAVIDGILRIASMSSFIGISILAPRMAEVLDKPTGKIWKKLDQRARDRELRRIVYYMKNQGLVDTENYEHGIKITKAGKKRLSRVNINKIQIVTPKKWDKKWRLIFYDIPESHKVARDALIEKLKQLGFYNLQRSVLIYPYPCRDEITSMTTHWDINQYVTYIETNYIDQEPLLKKKFKLIKNIKL